MLATGMAVDPIELKGFSGISLDLNSKKMALINAFDSYWLLEQRINHLITLFLAHLHRVGVCGRSFSINPLSSCWMPTTILNKCNVWFLTAIQKNNEQPSVSDRQQVATDVPLHGIQIQYWEHLVFIHWVMYTRFPLLLKFVLEIPLICPSENKCYLEEVLEKLVICWWKHPSWFVDLKARRGKIGSRMISFYNGHYIFVPKWPERLHWRLKAPWNEMRNVTLIYLQILGMNLSPLCTVKHCRSFLERFLTCHRKTIPFCVCLEPACLRNHTSLSLKDLRGWGWGIALVNLFSKSLDHVACGSSMPYSMHYSSSHHSLCVKNYSVYTLKENTRLHLIALDH